MSSASIEVDQPEEGRMNENTKATQTWESVYRGRIVPAASQRWNLSFSKFALLSYRCLVAAGIIITIIIMINLDHKQYRLLNFVNQRDVTTTPNGPEYGNHSKTDFPRHGNLSDDHHVYPMDYQTVFKYMIPSNGWIRRNFQLDYVVNGPGCEIPNYTPFHNDVKLFYRKYEEMNCTSKPLLTSVTLSASNTFVLNFHRQHLVHYELDPKMPVECHYRYINTTNDNFMVHYEYEIFDKDVELKSSADGVRVTCEQSMEEIYENMHFLVPDKAGVLRKMVHVDDSNDTDESLSVIIVGFDAVSRLNLLRTMPETVKYMEHNGWYAFRGYHKIEKNTLHNLIGPLLTGHSGDQLEETGCVGNGSLFGSCPWIWEDFAQKHYITAYGEDGSSVDSFTEFGKFKKQPTDYFLRPLVKAAEELIVEKGNVPYSMCIGPKRSIDYILDFSADFAARFVNYPTFSLFWLNSPGRTNMNYPAMVDQKIVSYFDSLNSSGALNRTMVVFVSDHGSQLWLFRQTYMGFVEDSLPFLYVWLPKWYREKHPSKANNLDSNRFRLTSHFDLHLTLLNVLGMHKKAAGCRRCVSLFEPVSWNRRCVDAGIVEESCACRRYVEICNNSTVVRELASLAVAHMNNVTAKYSRYVKEGYNCSTLHVSRITLARREVPKYPRQDGQLYVIHISTTPGNGIEEAVIRMDHNNTAEVKSVTEYSYYERRGFCMNSLTAKPFCSCRLSQHE